MSLLAAVVRDLDQAGGSGCLTGSVELQRLVINSDVLQLLPSLLRHGTAAVRLAAAWTATNLAYDARDAASQQQPVRPLLPALCLGPCHSLGSCESMRMQKRELLMDASSILLRWT